VTSLNFSTSEATFDSILHLPPVRSGDHSRFFHYHLFSKKSNKIMDCDEAESLIHNIMPSSQPRPRNSAKRQQALAWGGWGAAGALSIWNLPATADRPRAASSLAGYGVWGLRPQLKILLQFVRDR
jgi:hypothetical protein